MFILKLAGILLLVLLGLVILVLGMVCLVPIRYQLKARYAEKLKAKGEVSWLLRIFRVSLAAIRLQILCKIKALGFCLKKMHIGRWGEEGEPEESKGDKQVKEEGIPALKEAREEKKEKEPEAKKDSSPQKVQKDKYDLLFERLEKEEKRREEEKAKTRAEAGEPRETEKEAFLEKAMALKQQFQDFWEDEENQDAVILIERQLLRLGKHLLPTHFLLEGEIGLKDPADTGRLVGSFYRFYPIYGDSLRLQGVYDRQCMNVYLEIKGRIRLGILVEILVRLLLNRRCRSWARRILKKDKAKDKRSRKDKRTQKGMEQTDLAVSG